MENSTSTIVETLSTILPSVSGYTTEYTTGYTKGFTTGYTTEAPTDVHAQKYFSWYDYILFLVILCVAASIGIYYGCCGKNQSSAKEYLMGGKQMKVLPVAISLVASHTSGISLMAIPADVYVFGASYWLGALSLMALGFITVYIYVPVFYELEITSTYEYLQRRFDKQCRKCASGLFALSLLLYLPIVVYIPALAFSAVTGIAVEVIAPLVCAVCIFYTTIGGIKALIVNDTIQFSITTIAMGVVFALGVRSAGGLPAVWQKAIEGQRLDIFNMDWNPTARDSFWAVAVGLTIHWTAHSAINQTCIQKFLAVPSLKSAKKVVAYYMAGMILVKTICVLTGLIIFSKYSDCDPFTTKQVRRNDQLLPYYVLDVAGHIPGLSGLFIAGIFSSALSTLSGSLNSLSGTLYEDFLKSFIEKRGWHHTEGYFLKFIVVLTGIFSTLMIFIVQHLGGLLSLSISVGSIAHGPLLSMFTMGVLIPRSNAKGAFWGALSSMVFMTYMIFGQNYYKSVGHFQFDRRPVSVAGCDLNITLANSTILTSPELPNAFFRVSHYWFTTVGLIVGVTVGVIISYLTNKNDPPVDRRLISPVARFLLPKKEIDKEMEATSNGYNYYTVQKAMEVVNEKSSDKEES